jgi:hypothetical protein
MLHQPFVLTAFDLVCMSSEIFCISGYAEETFRKRLGEDRDIHFLPKPFSLSQLAGKVREVMDKVPA